MLKPVEKGYVPLLPRDGLQNEATVVATAAKIALVEALADAGGTRIEVGAFVSPKWVPQMADTAEVFAGLTRKSGVRYSALVPNLKGLERARDCGVTEVAVFAAASETFSKKNINQTIDESLATYGDVAREAHAAGINVRAYLSTCFGCPFEGDVPVERVSGLTARLLDMGVFEVAVSDTIGIAHPGQVRSVLDVLRARFRPDQLALHFHDTRGTALANVLAALEYQIHTFDSSPGGLGGCPYAPGATGNLATEDLLYMLDGLGIETGIDIAKVTAASLAIEPAIGHALPSRYVTAVRSRAGSRPTRA
ncbi:MAG: hydroxymethylglutaryl-CoA lyase [Acidobacteria bacterium]|nr:MAG: hydroxymethylglutaryl-CoA lyase [Acidobacteriota bacterium]